MYTITVVGRFSGVRIPALVILLWAGFQTVRVMAQVDVKESERGAIVTINGELFTEYWREFNGTPILWPIIGPTGKPVTRHFPMAKFPGEREDHPHHRSLWFGHGDVNGLSYWDRDRIRHCEFELLESGPVGKIITRNEWLDREGKTICEDRRILRFGAEESARWIDFVITITARYGPVRFGDTKEGTFALRVAETIKVDAKRGGRIVNADGLVDQAAWGKKASWVDYYGPIDDEIVGIAVMNHPASFRYPTFWHVRTYGLFAANPFGQHDFTGNGDGSFELKEGESIRLAYRIWIHRGDTESGEVARAYERYASEPLP
ncbi:MAG: PmoA family protein [Thermoguttaceae bacterium]|nr:PmoA family protein [Thermoguttaceae bacterium]MDW8080090.1 PmoA family protein [Thermoguttaceae bacterium]